MNIIKIINASIINVFSNITKGHTLLDTRNIIYLKTNIKIDY